MKASCFPPASRSRIRNPIRSSKWPKEAGVEIICDIELLWRETEGKARFVAVTGTNGKSTTTALLGHLLGMAGPVSVGGNIGRGALDLEPPGENRTYVLEMSSYQLDLTRRFRPDVGVWLNLTPDHLDRHGDIRGYVKAKARMFVNMKSEDTAVVGIDEPAMQVVAAALMSQGRPQLVTVSVGRNKGAALFVDSEGTLFEGEKRETSFANLPTLRGLHNWQNAAVAWAAAKALGLYGGIILSAMESFPGLAHRMEVVTRRGPVLFRQRFQGYKRRRRGEGARHLRSGLLDRRRPGEGGRHHHPQGLFPAHRQGLPDRHCGGRILTGAGAESTTRHRRRSRHGGAHGGRRRGDRRPAGADRAPLAGLCVVRPVHRFRGARRGVPPRCRIPR